MSGSNSRRILVDDGNPRIRYNGEWKALVGWESPSNSDASVFNRTISIPGAPSSSISFNFNSSRLTVYAARIDGGLTMPVSNSYRCLVDGKPLSEPLQNPYGLSNGSYPVCEVAGLSTAVEHKLDLSFTYNPDVRVGLSHLLYDSVSGESLSEAGIDKQLVVQYRNDDSSVEYSGLWNDRGGVNFTSTGGQGDSLKFTFNGTSVSMYGALRFRTNFSDVISSCPYYIDGSNDPQYFLVPDNPSDYTIYDFAFLNISGLSSDREHSLAVTYVLNYDKPLIVDYFVVDSVQGRPESSSNGSTITSSGISAPSSTATSLPPPSGTSNHTGAIVGAVVGGVLGILLVAGLLFWFLRRRRNRHEKNKESRSATPFTQRTKLRPWHKYELDATATTTGTVSSAPQSSIPVITSQTPTSFSQTRPGSPRTRGLDSSGGTEGTQDEVVVHHEDSGFRLPREQSPPNLDGMRRTVEVPPVYTER